MVVMDVEDGGELRAFAPLFGEERARWPTSGKLSVQLAGLALNLTIYPAEPIQVTEEPLLAMERERLRAENDPEVETLDHVTVLTDSLRTLYSRTVFDGLTLEDVALELGVTTGRAHQLRSAGLKRLPAQPATIQLREFAA